MSLTSCDEYKSFRSNIALYSVVVGDLEELVWQYFDTGPKTVRCPVVCLPPSQAKANAFYKQCLGLSAFGYRVIAIQWPPYHSTEQWCHGFLSVIDALHLDKIHIFGCSLGGYLAQKFAEYCSHCPRVSSLILCNSFLDTMFLPKINWNFLIWISPTFLLKRILLEDIPFKCTDRKTAKCIDFIVEEFEKFEHSDLASRLSLLSETSHVNAIKLRNIPITLMGVYDECSLSPVLRDYMNKQYPNARRAYMKTGGEFPFLSRSDEVNMHIKLHLRQFEGTPESPKRSL